MPSQAQYNSLRPRGWAIANAQTVRLQKSWDDLAQEAGLTRLRKKSLPGSTPSEENNLIGDFH